MLTQAGSDSFTMTMMEGIIDYKTNTTTAVSKSGIHAVPLHCQNILRKTTCEWKILVNWKNESEPWIYIKDLK